MAYQSDMKFDDGSQQDMVEFMEALLDTLTNELKNCLEFILNINSHCGMEGIKRLFRTVDGKCHRCESEPDLSPKVFKILRLELPETFGQCVSLDTLLAHHFSIQVQDETMKCSHCCPHPGATCPHTGDCSRLVDTRNVMTQDARVPFHPAA